MKQTLCLMAAALAAVGCGGTVSLPGGTGGTGTTGTACGPAGGPGACTPVSLGTPSTTGGLTDMAVDDTHVYLADEGGQVIVVPIAGGSPSVLATLPSAYNNGLWLALDATNVYSSPTARTSTSRRAAPSTCSPPVTPSRRSTP